MQRKKLLIAFLIVAAIAIVVFVLVALGIMRSDFSVSQPRNSAPQKGVIGPDGKVYGAEDVYFTEEEIKNALDAAGQEEVLTDISPAGEEYKIEERKFSEEEVQGAINNYDDPEKVEEPAVQSEQ